MDLTGKTVLVTGGTGSFGSLFLDRLLADHDVAAVRVLSRDELKQSELRLKVDDERLRLLLGDVRDLDRLRMATRGVDVVVHAAALKQVPALEYNPFEAVKTNILGTQNLIEASIENRVGLVLGLSTDKAVSPTNLYGASKLCGERLLAQGGVYGDVTRFGAVRYGNVMGSRGSVIPAFREQAATGMLYVTDKRMTRFWITLEQAVDFVLSSLPLVHDGEVFVPKLPSAKILDMAEAVAPEATHFITGIRPGEKLHETLLTVDEARQARDLGDRYAILPYRPDPPGYSEWPSTLPDGYQYTSDGNSEWLGVEDIRHMIGLEEPAAVE